MTKSIDVLMFHPSDLEYQLDTIVDFLSLTHPYLLDSSKNTTCVELRPILRKGKDYKLSKSLALWNLDEKGIGYLRNFLEEHNGIPACLFYSIFSFDYHKKNPPEKRYRKGRINSHNAMFTNEIVLDFDGITAEEQRQIHQRLLDVQIAPYWIFTGHGYHAHILLDEDVYQLDVLKEFIALFRRRGFPVDEACKDAARLMRLPMTYNVKSFAKGDTFEKKNPPLCEPLQYSNYRYSLNELRYKLAQIPETVEFVEKPSPEREKDQKKAICPAPIPNAEHIELKKNVYPYISNYTIPDAVCKMLSHTPKGFRNSALGFLIGYFHRTVFMPKERIYQILSIWSEEACVPKMDKFQFQEDFNRIYHTYGGLPYDSKLASKFGLIPFESDLIISKKEVAISNHFFASIKTMTGKLVRMYLAIKLLEHVDKAATQEELSDLLKISTRSVRTTLQELVKTPHCYMVKGNAKNKIPNTYHTDIFYDHTLGHSLFSYNDLKCYVSELFDDRKRGNNELKLYLYMQYRFRSGEIFMSQSTFGEKLGLKQNSVSEIVSRLVDKGFLRVEKRRHELLPHFTKCYYILLR